MVKQHTSKIHTVLPDGSEVELPAQSIPRWGRARAKLAWWLIKPTYWWAWWVANALGLDIAAFSVRLMVVTRVKRPAEDTGAARRGEGGS